MAMTTTNALRRIVSYRIGQSPHSTHHITFDSVRCIVLEGDELLGQRQHKGRSPQRPDTLQHLGRQEPELHCSLPLFCFFCFAAHCPALDGAL